MNKQEAQSKILDSQIYLIRDSGYSTEARVSVGDIVSIELEGIFIPNSSKVILTTPDKMFIANLEMCRVSRNENDEYFSTELLIYAEEEVTDD